MASVTKKNTQERLRRNVEKWTQPLMDAGWTVFPSVLLERQRAFGLDAIDVNILLQLARYWWYADNPPHPTKKTIAECLGVDVSTVRKRIAAMEKDGLISRQKRFHAKHGGQQANSYHFDGLIESAKPFAEEAIQLKEQRKKEDVARPRRKKPRLAVVKKEE
jgi:predicted transcriptional regulator